MALQETISNRSYKARMDSLMARANARKKLISDEVSYKTLNSVRIEPKQNSLQQKDTVPTVIFEA